MTANPTPLPPEGVPVTQADREAAAEFYGKHLSRPNEVLVTAHMRAGKIDESPLINAFARHRIAATSAAQGEFEAFKEAQRQWEFNLTSLREQWCEQEARATEAEAKNARLREALGSFGQHKKGCNVSRALPYERRSGTVSCTCGFAAALDQGAEG
jgi:hypothetical protein